MLFSSLTFLLLFLPFTAVFYFVLPRAWRNTFLLVMSMFFYAWGEPRFLAVMLLEIATVWAGAAAVGAAAENGSERMQNILTALTVCTLVLILAVFKYLDFIIENIRLITGAKINPLGIVLPLGISFYTFQALSYVIDVRRGNVKAERNIHTVALYIALFPQLVAGPIIKYHEISAELRERETSMSDAADGVRRFIIGLGKKTLIANPLGEIADLGFSEDPASLAALPAWICAFAFTLQLFFDFSGYSDMAIGIGRIFGFHFPENFRYPFISRTISEFWRRWHISLSTWFRDYLYIPLGGSRKGLTRTILNLGFVFIVTGLWHGPTWTFVVWGAMNGALVIIERITGLNRERERPFLVSAALHVYCVLAFTLCFVVFNSSSIDHACSYFRAMAGLSMGSYQTSVTTLTHPELFAYAGVFSGFMRAARAAEGPEKHLKLLENPDRFNGAFRVFYRAMGTEDQYFESFAADDRLLEGKGLHIIRETFPGGHDWTVWRRCIRSFLPRLFREG